MVVGYLMRIIMIMTCLTSARNVKEITVMNAQRAGIVISARSNIVQIVYL